MITRTTAATTGFARASSRTFRRPRSTLPIPSRRARGLRAGGSVSIWDPKSTQLCTARWSRAPTRHGSAASPYRRGDDVAQHDLFLIVKYGPQVRMDMHHATCDREHGQWHGHHRPPATDIYSLGARTSHAWP
jgi:hypothetical protein